MKFSCKRKIKSCEFKALGGLVIWFIDDALQVAAKTEI